MNNYIRGRAKEYRTMKKLKQEGYDIVVRTAGSRGVFDIAAVKRSNGVIKFIQVKPRRYSPQKIQNLIDKNGWLNAVFKVVFEVRV